MTLAFSPCAASGGGESCTVYVYLDAENNMIKTRVLDEVPPWKRTSMMTYSDCKAKVGKFPPKKKDELPAEMTPEQAERNLVESASKRTSPERTSPSSYRKSRSKDWWSTRFSRGKRKGWWTLLMILSFAMSTAGGIGVLICAFKQSLGWGLVTIFLPFGSLIYTVLHWETAKAPFLVSMAGSFFMLVLTYVHLFLL